MWEMYTGMQRQKKVPSEWETLWAIEQVRNKLVGEWGQECMHNEFNIEKYEICHILIAFYQVYVRCNVTKIEIR